MVRKRIPKPKIRIVVPIVTGFDRVSLHGKCYKADTIILKEFNYKAIKGDVKYKGDFLFTKWFDYTVFEERIFITVDGVPYFIGMEVYDDT